VILARADEADLLGHFDAHPDLTIWFRAAWTQGGMRVAGLRRDGRIVALAGQDPQGIVHVHAAEGLAELVRECLEPGRSVSAITGPPDQVAAAIVALGLEGRGVFRTSREIVMALDLEALVVPELLAREGVVVRRAGPDDLPLLTDWRIRYFQEVHRIAPDGEALAVVRREQAEGRLWVLEDQGQIVNSAAFNAVYPRLVQVEHAYSPPELRAQQFGRGTVAGALLVARADGVRRAVLTTGENNRAAQGASGSMGFRLTHRFLVVIFVPEPRVRPAAAPR
jgi:hypothetical protein